MSEISVSVRRNDQKILGNFDIPAVPNVGELITIDGTCYVINDRKWNVVTDVEASVTCCLVVSEL